MPGIIAWTRKPRTRSSALRVSISWKDAFGLQGCIRTSGADAPQLREKIHSKVDQFAEAAAGPSGAAS